MQDYSYFLPHILLLHKFTQNSLSLQYFNTLTIKKALTSPKYIKSSLFK